MILLFFAVLLFFSISLFVCFCLFVPHFLPLFFFFATSLLFFHSSFRIALQQVIPPFPRDLTTKKRIVFPHRHSDTNFPIFRNNFSYRYPNSFDNKGSFSLCPHYLSFLVMKCPYIASYVKFWPEYSAITCLTRKVYTAAINTQVSSVWPSLPKPAFPDPQRLPWIPLGRFKFLGTDFTFSLDL